MKHDILFKLLASYYALYIKTQSYHWNVVGKNFAQLHEMFELQYKQVSEEIDEIAERMRILGDGVPASLSVFASLSVVSGCDLTLDDKGMVKDLLTENERISALLNEALLHYESTDDAVTTDFLTQKLANRQKDTWFLRSTIS